MVHDPVVGEKLRVIDIGGVVAGHPTEDRLLAEGDIITVKGIDTSWCSRLNSTYVFIIYTVKLYGGKLRDAKLWASRFERVNDTGIATNNETECTCQSLLVDHLPGCPYIAAKEVLKNGWAD